MTTTNAERCRRYKAKRRGENVPPLKRGRLARVRVVVEDAPTDTPRQLREPQRVTLWNVRTGQTEERWE